MVTAKVERISPATAKQLLAKDTKHRKIDTRHLAFLCEEIESGRWDPYNGETIKINGQAVVDGRHRLRAIVTTGRTLPVLVVRDVSSGAFDTVDQGKRRTLSEALAAEGYAYSAVLAGAIRVFAITSGGEFIQNRQFSIRRGMSLLEKNPGLRKSIEFCLVGGQDRYIFAAKYIGAGIAVGTHYQASRIHRNTADVVYEQLLTGVDLKAGDPILTLRNWLMFIRDEQDLHVRWDRRLSMVIRAWNSWRNDQTLNTRIKKNEFTMV